MRWNTQLLYYLCTTSRRLNNQTCSYISLELWKGDQSFFCCCHAVFQGVSRWLNSGVHLCVDVSVTGLLLHSQSHVDSRYKKGLVNTMVNRAYRLSSTKEGFAKECNKLRTMFSKLHYPKRLVDSNINKFSQEPDKEIHPLLSTGPSVYINIYLCVLRTQRYLFSGSQDRC